MLTHVGDFWDKLPGPHKDKGGDYNCDDLQDACKLIKWT